MQFREALLDRLVADAKPVVFGVGDRRRVVLVVAPVVGGDLGLEARVLGLRFLGGKRPDRLLDVGLLLCHGDQFGARIAPVNPEAWDIVSARGFLAGSWFLAFGSPRKVRGARAPFGAVPGNFTRRPVGIARAPCGSPRTAFSVPRAVFSERFPSALPSASSSQAVVIVPTDGVPGPPGTADRWSTGAGAIPLPPQPIPVPGMALGRRGSGILT